MGSVELQPELRTAGGELLAIYRDGNWIGDMYLVYRENDLLTGTVNLDEGVVDEQEVEEIGVELRSYITSLSYALNVRDTNVNVLFGRWSLLEDFDGFSDFMEEEEEVAAETEYERWIVGQGKSGIEYQVYDADENLVAEAVVDIRGTKIFGEVHFTDEPDEREMEDIEAVLLKDYDHDLIDQYNFTYYVNGAEYESVEVTVDEDEDPEDERDESLINLVAQQEEADDYEERERAEVVFDLVDSNGRSLGQSTFLYSEDGVDVNVDLLIKTHEDTAHQIMQAVFREALTDPMEWVNIRMMHKGKVVDGFHFERGETIKG